MPATTILQINAEELAAHLEPLTDLVCSTVQNGAAISFMQPFDETAGRAFWLDDIVPALNKNQRILFIADHDGQLAGAVQLIVHLPPNQPHRCEVTKLMVHPHARRRGIAQALMKALEQEARTRAKTLITLDTRTGDAAEPLYSRLGYRTAGVIPGFALDPDGHALHATTYMYKTL